MRELTVLVGLVAGAFTLGAFVTFGAVVMLRMFRVRADNGLVRVDPIP